MSSSSMLMRPMNRSIKERAHEKLPRERKGQSGDRSQRQRSYQIKSTGKTSRDRQGQHHGARNQAASREKDGAYPLWRGERYPGAKDVPIETALVLDRVRKNNIPLSPVKVAFPLALIHQRIIPSRML